MTDAAALPEGAPPAARAAAERTAADLRAGLAMPEIGRRRMEEADAEVAALRRSDPPDAPLACAAGCAACCHMGVDVTVFEAAAVAAHLETRVDPRARARLHRRVLETAARTKGMDPHARRRAAVPCALLEDDGRCAVYEARPVLCRATMATDAAACHRAFLEGRAGEERMWHAPAARLKQAMLGSGAAYELATGQRGVYELHAILAAALRAAAR
jgi:Fe-S-cluster containining protein